MAWEARSGLKPNEHVLMEADYLRLNGLGSPFGIETRDHVVYTFNAASAKWPGKPVRD